MCAAEVSTGLHVNHGVASAAAISGQPLATPDLVLKHPDENICNISLKQMKTLETCVCSHCNYF
jgi:hypothetical protein